MTESKIGMIRTDVYINISYSLISMALKNSALIDNQKLIVKFKEITENEPKGKLVYFKKKVSLPIVPRKGDGIFLVVKKGSQTIPDVELPVEVIMSFLKEDNEDAIVKVRLISGMDLKREMGDRSKRCDNPIKLNKFEIEDLNQWAEEVFLIIQNFQRLKDR